MGPQAIKDYFHAYFQSFPKHAHVAKGWRQSALMIKKKMPSVSANKHSVTLPCMW